MSGVLDHILWLRDVEAHRRFGSSTTRVHALQVAMTSGKAVVLIGFRGVGKTTLGVRLAERRGLPFVDTDDLIESRAGRSISDIFASKGEASFRELESRVIAELDPRATQIIATGGGAVISERNRHHLAALGRVIWLTLDAPTMVRRIAGSNRPALTHDALDQEVERLYSERAPLYAEIADHVVEVGGSSVEELCAELERLLRD